MPHALSFILRAEDDALFRTHHTAAVSLLTVTRPETRTQRIAYAAIDASDLPSIRACAIHYLADTLLKR